MADQHLTAWWTKDLLEQRIHLTSSSCNDRSIAVLCTVRIRKYNLFFSGTGCLFIAKAVLELSLLDQADLKVRNLPASPSQMLGLQACTTTAHRNYHLDECICSQWDYDNLFNQKLTCWNGTFSTKSTPFSVGNKLKIPCFFLIHHAVHTPVHHNACRLTPWSSCCRSTSGLCINHVFLLCKLHMCHSRLPVNIMLDNWIALEQLDNSIALAQLVHYGLVYNNASIEVDMYAGLCVVNWDFFLKFKLLAVVVLWGKEY